MTRTLDVSDLPEEVVRELEQRIKECRSSRNPNPSAARRTFGWWKGKLVVPESFFDPMSEEELHPFDADIRKFAEGKP